MPRKPTLPNSLSEPWLYKSVTLANFRDLAVNTGKGWLTRAKAVAPQPTNGKDIDEHAEPARWSAATFDCTARVSFCAPGGALLLLIYKQRNRSFDVSRLHWTASSAATAARNSPTANKPRQPGRHQRGDGLHRGLHLTLPVLKKAPGLPIVKCSNCELFGKPRRSRSLRCLCCKLQSKKWSTNEKKVKNMASGLECAVCQTTLIVKFGCAYHFTTCIS